MYICIILNNTLNSQVEIERIDAATPVQVVQPQLGPTGIMEAPPVSMFVKFPRPCLIGVYLSIVSVLCMCLGACSIITFLIYAGMGLHFLHGRIRITYRDILVAFSLTPRKRMPGKKLA
jgi:hypothetical protein